MARSLVNNIFKETRETTCVFVSHRERELTGNYKPIEFPKTMTEKKYEEYKIVVAASMTSYLSLERVNMGIDDASMRKILLQVPEMKSIDEIAPKNISLRYHDTSEVPKNSLKNYLLGKKFALFSDLIPSGYVYSVEEDMVLMNNPALYNPYNGLYYLSPDFMKKIKRIEISKI